MFSSRFYILCFLMCKLLVNLNVTPITFHRGCNQFGLVTKGRIEARIRFTLSMVLFWGVAGLYSAYLFRQKGDLDRFNLMFAYWLTGGLSVASMSLLYFQCHDLIFVLNGLFQFMTLIHRKLNNKSIFFGLL